MGTRVMIGLSVVAVVVAVVAVAALLLAAFHGDADAPVASAGVVGKGARDQDPRSGVAAADPASQGPAAPAPRPVPALDVQPERGPAFAIARLRPGATSSLWSKPGGDPIETIAARTDFGSPTIFSVVRTRPGWLGITTPDLPNDRLGWVRRDPRRFEVYWTKYSLRANLVDHSLTLRYGDAVVGSYPITVGGAGTETPPGRYGVTDALNFDESPSYGCCALALSGRQANLPSDWIGGDRLAIHGTPGPVGGAESHGCMRATDATMRTLFRRVPLGAPVFVDE